MKGSMMVAASLILLIGAVNAQSGTGIEYYAAKDQAVAPVNESSGGCADSDGGLDYALKGVTTGSNGVKWDRCANPAGNYDFYWLREYYCTPSGMAAAQEHQCINGCENGTCFRRYVTPAAYQTNDFEKPAAVYPDEDAAASGESPTNGMQPADINGCTESDGGHDYYDRGTVTDRTEVTKTDFCVIGGSDSRLREYYCGENGYVQSTEIGCVGGCLRGACRPSGTYRIR